MNGNKIRSILTVLLVLSILSGTSESIFLPIAKAGGGSQPQLGIMAYIDTGKDIDLNYAKSLFKTINTDDPDEIEGIYSFYVDNYNTEDVNIYITSDGFIAAFYTDKDPVSRIISWSGDKTVFSKFATAITYIGQYLGVNINYNDIKYYHYQYPDANRMLIATQSVGESTVDTYSYGNLEFNIPSDATVYETSYSFYLNDIYNGQNGANIAIDTDPVSNTMNNGIIYDFYNGYISTDTDHLLGIMSGPYAQAGVAIIIIYKDDNDNSDNRPTIKISNADNSFDGTLDNPESTSTYDPSTYTPTYTYEPTPIPTPIRTPRITVPMPTTVITEVPIQTSPGYTPVQTTQAPLKPKKASIDLHGERTNVEMGQQILLKGSVVSFNTNADKMHAQVIIIPPSGFSVASADFVKSPAGQYTSDFELDPGKGKDIEVTMIPNEPGEFNVVSKITYYFGDDKNTGEYEETKLPIKVREKGSPGGGSEREQRPGGTPSEPGFEIIPGIVILVVSYLLFKNRRI